MKSERKSAGEGKRKAPFLWALGCQTWFAHWSLPGCGRQFCFVFNESGKFRFLYYWLLNHNLSRVAIRRFGVVLCQISILDAYRGIRITGSIE